jgi:hypothetical protein
MLFALGAVSSALDALQSLTTSKPALTQTTGFTQAASNPFSIDGDAGAASGVTSSVNSGNRPQISPETMSALLAAQSQSSTGSTAAAPMSRQDALKDIFSQIDADGDGQITKSEFEDALGAGGTNLAQADDVFGKLDADGDGSVSLDEMAKALMGRRHGHRDVAESGKSDGNGSDGADPLMQALDGASSTSVTNSDGSTTRTITYADGSKVSMTTPAATKSASGTSNSATSSYNWIEQMIQREAQALAGSTANSLSLTA